MQSLALHTVDVFFVLSAVHTTTDALMPNHNRDVLDVLQIRNVIRVVCIGHACRALTSTQEVILHLTLSRRYYHLRASPLVEVTWHVVCIVDLQILRNHGQLRHQLRVILFLLPKT